MKKKETCLCLLFVILVFRRVYVVVVLRGYHCGEEQCLCLGGGLILHEGTVCLFFKSNVTFFLPATL